MQTSNSGKPDTEYLFSNQLSVFRDLAIQNMQLGLGAVLLLTGEPGGGKTEFASAVAKGLGAQMYKYQCAPDKDRTLLYDYDLNGIVTGKKAWLPGPAWHAFEESGRENYAVLLIDEADKTHQNFDAFLLELLEQYRFTAPKNDENDMPYVIQGKHTHLMIILTSNGRRPFRPEVLRRCWRIQVPFPERPRLDNIIKGIGLSVGVQIPDGLVELTIRVGAQIRKDNPENAPSPKEMALSCINMLILAVNNVYEPEIWRQVAASFLIKDGGPEAIDKALKYKWTRAFLTESNRPNNGTNSFNKKYPVTSNKRKKS